MSRQVYNIRQMRTNIVKKYKWERGEEWTEKWYQTELCFQTLKKNYPSPCKLFAPKGLQVITLNKLWFYEKNTSKLWDEGKNNAAQDLDQFKKLVNQTEPSLNKVEEFLKDAVSFKTIDIKKLKLFKIRFKLLWGIFLSDLGTFLDSALDLQLKDKLSFEQIQKAIDYCFNFKHNLGIVEEEANLTKIKVLLNKKHAGQKITYPEISNQIKEALIDHTKRFQYLTGTELDASGYMPQDFYESLVEQTYVPSKKSSLPTSVRKTLKRKDIQLIETIRRHVYFDNYAADLNSKLDFILNRLISNTHKISPRDLSWYSFSELDRLIKFGKKLSNTDLKERRIYRIMWQIDNKVQTFYGIKNYGAIKQLIDKPQQAQKVKQFRGTTASLGNVTGIVKIVNKIEDVKKVQKGDILVAINTHPDLIIAIKRSVGIITDYGGMTSHAAIISREFNIPCIVGTKIATQVLKDGSKVNLNANLGVIKILKN